MLTETDRELIAAAVGGGLTPTQDAAFRRLVASSPEAAKLYAALQTDARRLRSLPRAVAPAGLEHRVIERMGSTPIVTPSRAIHRRSPNRLPYAIAATLLIGLAAGTYWFTVHSTDGVQVAVPAPTRFTPPNRVSPRVVHPPIADVSHDPEILPAPRGVTPIEPGPPRTDVAVVPPPVETAPLPRLSGAGQVVASGPFTDMRPFETVEVRVPFLLPVTDLDRGDARVRLLAELSEDPAYRLDLFTRDPHRAAEVFQAAARSAGVDLHIEGVAAERMRKKAPPTAWAIYTEALAPNDIAALLGHLAKATRNDKVTPFGVAHLVPAQQADHRELRELLGVDLGLWKRTPAATAPKPISADTADRVASALVKPGHERSAILLSFLPPAGRANPLASKEVRTFLDRRGVRLPDAVPLLIVIRTIG